MNPHKIVHSLIGHLCVLMTFGLLSPILAVAVAVTIVITSSMCIALVGRYAELRYGSNPVPSDEDIDEASRNDAFFKGSWTTLYYSKMCVVCGAGLFHAIMLFDVAGRETGVRIGLIFVATTIFFFVIVFVFQKSISEYVNSVTIVRAYSNNFFVLVFGPNTVEGPVNIIRETEYAFKGKKKDGSNKLLELRNIENPMLGGL
jgi:hypothetical protein